MPKKVALCIGQNLYDPNSGVSPLEGCVNDALLIGEMLRVAGFQVIRQVHDQAATQKGILGRLSTEVAKLREGDHFVFWNSSHGYQVRDRSGDELFDFEDEAINTYDTDPRDPLTDDKLGRIISRADPGAIVFLASDSCHSGTLTRAFNEEEDADVPRLWVPPADVRFRSGEHLLDLGDYLEGAQETPKKAELEVRRFGRLRRRTSEEEMRHLLLTGCKSDQLSFDAKFPQGWHGAMTYNFVQVVLESWKKGRVITYAEAHSATAERTRQNPKWRGQWPQLEGPGHLKSSPVFGYVP